MNDKQFKEMLALLNEIKKGIDTLVAAEYYNVESQEKMMKALTGGGEKHGVLDAFYKQRLMRGPG